MPPLAFTHAKYALAMFGMSVNEVPGWLVAAAPGLVPHCVVLTADVLAEDVLAGALLELELLVELDVLELELLLQPAAASAITAARTAVLRAESIFAFIS